MKRRNFFLSLLATAFGVKAVAEIPADYSYRAVESGRLTKTYGYRDEIVMSVRCSARTSGFRDIRYRRYRHATGEPTRLVAIGAFYEVNRSDARMAQMEDKVSNFLKRYPYAIVPSEARLAEIFSELRNAPNLAWHRGIYETRRAQRLNPHALHSVPFPVTYQELG